MSIHKHNPDPYTKPEKISKELRGRKRVHNFEARNPYKLHGLGVVRRWRKVWKVQQDVKAGLTNKDIMLKNDLGSEHTVIRWKRKEIPDWALKLVESERDGVLGKTFEEHTRDEQARRETNVSLDALGFCEDSQHLNFALRPMQRLILKAFYGLAFTEEEKLRMAELQKMGKCTWKEQKAYRELVIVGGMKGGKTSLVGAIACIEEFLLYKLGDFRKYYGFPPGKEVLILNVATNADQSKLTIFAETERLIKSSPYYRRRVFTSTTKDFHFQDTNVKLQSGHSNSSALVGPLCKAVLFDELDRFTEQKEGRSSGRKMYFSITRNATPFGLDGKIVAISSPIREGGMIMQLFDKTKGDPEALGFWLSTWEMNENLPFDSPVLQAELRKSPEDFWRDYGAQPAKALEKYYRDRKKIDAVFERGAEIGLQNPVGDDGALSDDFKGDAKYSYHLHLDPAINNCAYGIALTHRRDDGKVIADLVHRFLPPGAGGEIDFQEVKQFLVLLAQRFPTIRTISYDVYMVADMAQELRKLLNLEARFLEVNKEVCDKLKIEAVYADKLACHPCEALRMELRGLELENGKKVVKPNENEEGIRGSKDLADALAGSVWASLQDDFVEPACSAAEFAEAELDEQIRRGGSSLWH